MVAGRVRLPAGALSTTQRTKEPNMIDITLPGDLYKLRDAYGYLIHGDDANGATDLEFPNIGAAAAFVEATGLESRAIIRDDTVKGFFTPVVLTITIAPAYDNSPEVMERIRSLAHRYPNRWTLEECFSTGGWHAIGLEELDWYDRTYPLGN
jgi:hypothetical protein